MKFLDFLQAVVPVRFKTAEQLISQDDHNNTYNYKYTFSVEMVPICRDDLICLPRKVALSLGNINPIVICTKVSSLVHLMDPLTLQTTEISSTAFWSTPFRSISNAKNLIEYTVLDVIPIGTDPNGKYLVCDVQVARSSDFGRNDTLFNARTHLGRLLKPGDTALGYDLSSLNVSDSDMEAVQGKDLPDLILMHKTYPEARKRNKKRHWQLKVIDKGADDDSNKKYDPEKESADYESFMRDLEENPEMRSQINLYKVKGAENILAHNQQEAANDMVDDDAPTVQLGELLEDLTIDE